MIEYKQYCDSLLYYDPHRYIIIEDKAYRFACYRAHHERSTTRDRRGNTMVHIFDRLNYNNVSLNHMIVYTGSICSILYLCVIFTIFNIYNLLIYLIIYSIIK